MESETGKSREFLSDFRDVVKSEEDGDRHAAWRRLHHHITHNHVELSESEINEFIRAYRAERASHVNWEATKCLLSISLLGNQRAQSEFATWLWKPMKDKSAVFRAFDPRRRRDEDAVIELARVLHSESFPQTEFNEIPLNEPAWPQILGFNPKAVCVVGRLRMFGEQAISEMGSNETRYHFPAIARPQDLDPGKLNPEYHRIIERNPQSGEGGGNPSDKHWINEYVTTQNKKSRTDYGIFQRYFDPGSDRFVFIIAGCSTLGTLGAVRLATRHFDMSMPDDFDVGERDTLEILIEVESLLSQTDWRWRPRRLDILRAFLGDHEWFVDDHEWGPRTPDVLTVKLNADGAPTDVVGEPGHSAHWTGKIVRFIYAVYQTQLARPDLKEITEADWGEHAADFEHIFSNATNRNRVKKVLRNKVKINTQQRTIEMLIPIEVVPQP